ncbi:Pyrrolo-quinoline quinone [Seminavis robusta]|uniref:Pyrrolo-quinoline quinone n=1 Tax=Seminavis robusta TaxID=568900 RepID=A0A9N8HFQ1_9STRA|nr:Pyrrolo-quinoline quinone [Seminavis robusta]|eukprot:Sro466_g148870.1 Pyrrolo-quinoline quinone (487) ;mRNA; f:50357-51903
MLSLLLPFFLLLTSTRTTTCTRTGINDDNDVIQWRGNIAHTAHFNVTLLPGQPRQLYRHHGLNKGVHSAAKSSPVVLADGETFLQAGDTGILYRIEIATGQPLWAAAQLGFSSFGYHSTPCAIYRDDDDNTPDLAIIGSYDGVLSAFDLETGHRVWETSVGEHIGASPTCTSSFIYIAVEFSTPRAAGGVCKVQVDTGDKIWCSYTMGSHSHCTAGVDYQHNVVVAGSNDNYLHVFRETDGVTLAKYNTSGAIKGPILMHHGFAIFGSWSGNIFAIDISHLASKVPTTATADTIQIERGPGLYKWPPIESDKKFMSGVALDPTTNLLYTGGHDYKIRCIDFHTGKVRWEYQTNSYILSSPIVLNNAILSGSSDGYVYALDKATGKALWSYILGRTGRITASVDVSHDGKYILYASDSYGFTAKNQCKGKPGSLHVLEIRETDASGSMHEEVAVDDNKEEVSDEDNDNDKKVDSAKAKSDEGLKDEL